MKFVGTGNDFVLIDGVANSLAGLKSRWSRVAQAVCDRRTGIGADGLLVLEPSRSADVRMRIFNPDGSEPAMCGNGIRCLARYAHLSGAARGAMSIETRAGIKRAQVGGRGGVRVDLGRPRLLRHVSAFPDEQAGGHADLVDSGVPHLVCWMRSVDEIDVGTVGRRLRNHRLLKPEGANVDFIQLLEKRLGQRGVQRYRIRMRTYERGVEAETQACGTGAVASAAAVAHTFPFRGLKDSAEAQTFEISVEVPGGELRVSLTAAGDAAAISYGHAYLEGEAREVFSGRFQFNGRARR